MPAAFLRHELPTTLSNHAQLRRVMHYALLLRNLWIFCLLASTGLSFADGMVFPEVLRPKVEIPNQQALIHFSGGLERLVIETSFLGEGTNFAWVVPLPSAPEVQPVSESFFVNLRGAFQPQLIHGVTPYYAGILLVCGLIYLGGRAMRDEPSWAPDLPVCVLLIVGASVLGGHVIFGFIALALALATRLFARTPAIYALLLLVGTTFAGLLTLMSSPHVPHLVRTLDSGDSLGGGPGFGGVTVVSVQRAGVFESTTLRGRASKDVLDWLERNGYQVAPGAEPAIRRYIERGWVFVASKARRDPGGAPLAALHPLAFTFPAKSPVYPTSLTALNSRNCAMDLFVFGNHRAAARRFSAVRCDRLASTPSLDRGSGVPGLRISDPEILGLIGNSTTGTKLSATLTPAQMAADVEIKSGFFWSFGRRVYSRIGAVTIALNAALPLAALAWLLLEMTRGGWRVNERWISRWRWRSLAAASALGLAIFLWLPKVEVERALGFGHQEEAGNCRIANSVYIIS